MDPSAPFPLPPIVDPFAGLAATANPAPPQHVAAAPSHPPYAEMICAAIAALKERDGSSKRAIAKYIDEAYSDLPPTHSALLTHHLKRLQNSGIVVMVKKSYKLPSPRSDINGISNTNHVSLPAAGDAPSGPKRGRGRPPKPKPVATLPQIDAAQPISAQPVLTALGLVDESAEKKAPGRPRKSVSMAEVQAGAPLPKRSRGRPPKLANGGPVGGDVVGPVLAKRRPGRPPGRKPKSIASINGLKSKRRPGRPAKAQSVPLIVPYATADIPKPRGRPKLVPVAAGNGVVKRRGRPAKVGGVVAKKGTGKSPGRPRKNPIMPVSDEAVELKKKLEYFQSKVMQVVGVLKPQLSGGSSISAVAAVQELEGLATLDISAPLQVEAPIQVPVQLQVPVEQPMLLNSEAIW